MVTPSSVRIIKDVDLALKALEIVHLTNGGAVEGLADRNVHRRKVSGGKVVGPKVRGTSAKSPKICSCTVIFFKLCLKKKHNIADFFPDIHNYFL